MKSKEEMIEAISENDKIVNACRDYDSGCGTVCEIVEEVIEALCRALPELTFTTATKLEKPLPMMKLTDFVDAYDNGSELYNQLKQWGK